MATTPIRTKLDGYLTEHGLTAYRLVQVTKGEISEASVYDLARGKTKRLDLTTLAAVMAGLETLVGKPVSFDDLLTRSTPSDLTAAGVPYTGDEETDAVLNTMPEVLERVAQFEEGQAKPRPLRAVIADLGLEPKKGKAEQGA